MKRNFILLVVIILIFIVSGIKGYSQLLLNEDFDYPAGNLITAHGWSAHSGAGTQPVTVSSGGLTFSGYISSGIGNAALVDNNGEDDNRTFAVQSAGTVYVSFMVNVTTTAAGYFFHLGGDPIGSTFRGKVFMDATNHFGVSVGNNTGTYAASTYNLGSTYLLVLKYEIVAGSTNDIVSLFIFDSSVPGTEPAVPTVGPLTDAAMSDINPGSVALRQFNASQNLMVDGIRVGLSWSDILPSGINPPTIQATNISFSTVTSTGMNVGWTSGNGAKRVVVMNIANSFTNPADGTDPVANPVYGGSGEQVVYNGNGSSVAVSGLMGNTTYWYRVYEYNGAGSSTRYLTTTATLNPNSQATPVVATPPVLQSPTVTSAGTDQAVLGGNITSNGGAPITERGTVWKYTTGVTISDNKLAEGGTSTGVFSHLRSGFTPQTQVFTRAFATNSAGTGFTDEISFFTLSLEPIGHVTGFSAAATGNTAIDLSWTTASTGATGYLILMKPGATAPTGLPSDGVAYSDGNTIGDGLIVAIVTPASLLTNTISGLSPGTTYSFTIFPYAWDGAHPETHNYYTHPVIPVASATTTGTPSSVYTWIGPDNGAWGTASNWSPARTAPAASDVLQFNDGSAKTITGLTTQSIARFVMSNNTTINLQSPSAATLTLTGALGADLDIPAGCSLNFNAVNAITMTLATNSTASVSGNIKFTSTASTAHRLTAADQGAIAFNNGAVFTAGPFFSGNAFGTSSLGSVIFASGSTYLQQAGSNPFGAGQPNSVVVFQPGSLFKVTANLTPSFAGRVYANFELDAPGITLSPSGTQGVSIDNLTITNGTLNFNMTGPNTGIHQIKGNITIQAGAFLNFNPTTASVISFSSGAVQTIISNGTLTANTNSTWELINGTNLTAGSDLSINGHLKLTSGFLTLGNSSFTLSATSNITGTPSASAMIVPTGPGQLIKTMPAGFSGTILFPVGDNTDTPEYSPVSLNFSSGSFASASKLMVNLANAKYPTDPNMVNYLKRYWNISSSGVTNFTCQALFQYLPSDVTGNENEIFTMQVEPAPYTSYGLVNAAAHQLVISSLTSFGTFTGSLPKPVMVTLPATNIDATTATLNGTAVANYLNTDISFEYGPTTAYGTVVAATPANLNGGTAQPALANIVGLAQNTTYHFRIIGTSVQGTSYGDDLTFTTTCPVPAAAGTVSGPAAVCPGGSGYVYSVAAIPNVSGYTWNLPSGATITAGSGTNSITVSYSPTAVSGSISVFGTSVCGSGAVSPSLPVSVYPAPVVTVTGPAVACINSTGNIYSTEPGMTGYSWIVSAGGTITAGAGTNSITVSWSSTGSKSVSVSYTNSNGCQPVQPTVYTVNVNPLPVPTITGPSTVCANAAGIVYTTETGMNAYNWTVSLGGTIVAGTGTNAITVLWPYAGQRTVSVTYATPDGCLAAVPTVYNVTVHPAAVPVIGSSNDPCVNSSGNQYITNTGMSNYQWNISNGGIIDNGLGTNTINVTWNASGAQWVSVSYTNSFGCTTVTPTVYNLYVETPPNMAGAITGTSQLCAGTQGVSYSCPEVNNATSYQWNLPPGATIITGAGTNNITVNFSPTAQSGNITVSGVNRCGAGPPSPAYTVTVNPIPPAPVINASGPVLTSSANSGNQWFYEGTAIPNATGKNYTATQTGYYWCQVTLNGCTSPISNKIYIVITGVGEKQLPTCSLYPSPNQGKFTLKMENFPQESALITIRNLVGSVVWTSSLVAGSDQNTMTIQPEEITSGLYFVEVKAGNFSTVLKTVVRK